VVIGVRREPRTEVPGLRRPPHHGQQPLGLPAGRRRDLPHGHGQRKRLEQDPARVHVVQFLRIQARYPGPLVGLDLDEPFLLQHPQYLAQRGAAHAELPGQAHL